MSSLISKRLLCVLQKYLNSFSKLLKYFVWKFQKFYVYDKNPYNGNKK
ncbi:hypothetical protein PCS8203_01321 [Streptococcus pneumoniae PCS8203]|jgi:hypothetical protein|uniref:Uncharacterized protein n=1 Tax=Streptococcus pneumoniae (strain JJA) TaxID=488222 RepID=C1CD64_STRZJ|nr:hypothetical protein SPJ_0652 [Streptococcus pneumoniae JJA]EHD31769.1 hypothetical protein SPAR19_0703 [Streptococcus pneumoniae GA11184]EHD67899.1 hypothetical protein SPAR125_0597 [Streptococcus pneumoniae 5787-06]EHD80339.1 hypothetical protein SPAR144_0639 [Streptococcus pneumoniae NP170]EHZ04416.1 hypothetical protein SPAR4_0696 [Streptococcus pneumoniae GA04175]EHZ64704.1 hypothetical protein SPAR99_1219 [Streptococcus pneumoniae GA47522]EIC50330.1 hypothetical protein CGSSpSV36_052